MLKNRHNNFLLSRTVFLSFWNADWDGAHSRRGALGVAGEFISSLFGTNTWPFFIDSEGDWDKSRISRLLGQNGIKIWGWGYHNGRFFFRVKKRQAHWAQYILLKNRVPVKGRLLKSN